MVWIICFNVSGVAASHENSSFSWNVRSFTEHHPWLRQLIFRYEIPKFYNTPQEPWHLKFGKWDSSSFLIVKKIKLLHKPYFLQIKEKTVSPDSMLTFSQIPISKVMNDNCLWTNNLKLNVMFSNWKQTFKKIDVLHSVRSSFSDHTAE